MHRPRPLAGAGPFAFPASQQGRQYERQHTHEYPIHVVLMDPLVGLVADPGDDCPKLRDVAMAKRTSIREVPVQWVEWLNTMSAERLIMMRLICEQENIPVDDEGQVKARWESEISTLRAQLAAVDQDLKGLHIQIRALSARRKRLREMLGLSPTRRST